MPLLNYTTKVDVYTTIGDIQGCLVKHGARKIMQDYDCDGRPQALCFAIDTKTYYFVCCTNPDCEERTPRCEDKVDAINAWNRRVNDGT